MALPRAAAAWLEESSPLCSCTSAAALNFQHGKHGLGGNPSPPEVRGVHGLETPASSPEVFPGNLPARQPIGSEEQPRSGRVPQRFVSPNLLLPPETEEKSSGDTEEKSSGDGGFLQAPEGPDWGEEPGKEGAEMGVERNKCTFQ